MLYYARESRWNTKCCRGLHPSLTDAFIRKETRRSIKWAGYLTLCLQDLKYDGFAFHCFKRVHALLKRTMEGFYSAPTIGTAHISSLMLLLWKSFIFSILPDHECLEAEQFSLLLQSSTCLWGLVLVCGLAALFGSSSQPTHAFVFCPRWGHFGRIVGVTRGQAALNGPKQAVQIHSLLRLRVVFQEQHRVKCQQQTPLMNKDKKNGNQIQ